MARYIDVDKFVKDLGDEYHGMISDESLRIYRIIERLESAPTADVQEVRHGEWVRKNGEMYCSECGGEALMDEVYYKSPYCPKCGAKIDGGNAE